MTATSRSSRIPRPGRAKKGEKGVKYTIKYIRDLML